MTVVITVAVHSTTSTHWALRVAFGAMVVYLLLFRLTLPYSLVRRNPERSLLLLLPVLRRLRARLGPLVRGAAPPAARRESATEDNGGARPTPEVPPAAGARPGRGPPRGRGGAVRDHAGPGRDDAAPRHRRPRRRRDRRRSLHASSRETKYSRDPRLRREPGRHRRGGTVRDLIDYDGPPTDPLRPLVRPAYLVPETKKIAELLKEFQASRITFAVVIDEYGGTAGLVTVEDIVEEIVGEIKDEYDLEAEPIAIEPDGAVLVAGRVNVDRLEQALEAPLADGDDVDTVGGLVAAAFGRDPAPGRAHGLQGVRAWRSLDAERKRVNRVRFRRKPAAAEDGGHPSITGRLRVHRRAAPTSASPRSSTARRPEGRHRLRQAADDAQPHPGRGRTSPTGQIVLFDTPGHPQADAPHERAHGGRGGEEPGPGGRRGVGGRRDGALRPRRPLRARPAEGVRPRR